MKRIEYRRDKRRQQRRLEQETPMHTSGRDIQTLQAWVDAPK